METKWLGRAKIGSHEREIIEDEIASFFGEFNPEYAELVGERLARISVVDSVSQKQVFDSINRQYANQINSLLAEFVAIVNNELGYQMDPLPERYPSNKETITAKEMKKEELSRYGFRWLIKDSLKEPYKDKEPKVFSVWKKRFYPKLQQLRKQRNNMIKENIPIAHDFLDFYDKIEREKADDFLEIRHLVANYTGVNFVNNANLTQRIKKYAISPQLILDNWSEFTVDIFGREGLKKLDSLDQFYEGYPKYKELFDKLNEIYEKEDELEKAVIDMDRPDLECEKEITSKVPQASPEEQGRLQKTLKEKDWVTTGGYCQAYESDDGNYDSIVVFPFGTQDSVMFHEFVHGASVGKIEDVKHVGILMDVLSARALNEVITERIAQRIASSAKLKNLTITGTTLIGNSGYQVMLDAAGKSLDRFVDAIIPLFLGDEQFIDSFEGDLDNLFDRLEALSGLCDKICAKSADATDVLSGEKEGIALDENDEMHAQIIKLRHGMDEVSDILELSRQHETTNEQ